MISRILSPFLAAAVAFCAVSNAQAAPIVRSASLFETLSIEGVSLSTAPRDAFNILQANGYTANGIATFDDWGKGSLSMVRGNYGGPEGQSEVTLGRADGRLAMITETLNRRGIDAVAEIGNVQSHFGIAADEPDCKLNNAGTAGSCQVRDHADGASATTLFTMSVLSTMILRSVSRPKELAKTLE